MSRTLHAGLWLTLALAACHPRPDNRQPSASPAADTSQAGYLNPPRVTSASRMDGGGVALSGHTDPEARVRLQSPGGPAYGVTAGSDGTWTLVMPPSPQVRLLGVSEVIGDRAVQSTGYLAVLPSPGEPAIMLRAGGGSQVFVAGASTPRISAIDFDVGGGASVSGVGRPGVQVRVTVDGASVGEIRPDALGRFTVAPPFTLKAGLHQAEVQSSLGHGQTDFVVSEASPISGPPFVGLRQADGWRIDWLTPGGAPQSTLVFDPPASGARP